MTIRELKPLIDNRDFEGLVKLLVDSKIRGLSIRLKHAIILSVADNTGGDATRFYREVADACYDEFGVHVSETNASTVCGRQI